MSGAKNITRIFSKNKTIKTLVIPEGTETIQDGAFEGCIKLTRAIVPKSVEFIGKDAFGNCSALINLVVPETIPFTITEP